MADASVQYDALAAIVAKIKAATLEGLDPSRVILEPVGDEKGKELAFISVFPAEPEDLPDEGGNLVDDVRYKVIVAMAASKSDAATMFPRILGWRQQIRRIFHNQRLVGVTHVQYTTVEPLAVVDRAAWFSLGLLSSGLRIVILSQEPRT